MRTSRSQARHPFDAFISHASEDRRMAQRLEAALGPTRVWLDRSDIRLGTLLGRELLTHLRKSRTLVLVWSKHAHKSPWVQTEWMSAVNLGKRLIPIVLDRTPLPQCLANTLWQSLRASPQAAIAELVRTVRGRRPGGGSVSPAMRLPDVGRDGAIDRVARAQASMFATKDAGDLAGARRQQRRLERQVAALVAKYPLDSRAAALWAYNAKNGVLIDHDAAIAAGIKIVDARLNEARWRFLHALWLDPFDPEALNGLGTIAWFAHDLDTAEFFVRAALRRLPRYPAARHDLALIVQLKRRGMSADQPWALSFGADSADRVNRSRARPGGRIVPPGPADGNGRHFSRHRPRTR
jgi:hypothetical protein